MFSHVKRRIYRELGQEMIQQTFSHPEKSDLNYVKQSNGEKSDKLNCRPKVHLVNWSPNPCVLIRGGVFLKEMKLASET